ncbi:tetratricopeptide repeat protein [Paenibacillus sp. GCM10012306]|uniref:tetratricopeptide repeat protein n=1 Tax=Paenibacillus sp. GCM10012306 TaxID=3317342 RepID=UPI0036108932
MVEGIIEAAVALRGSGQAEQARTLLLEQLEGHPQHARLHYQLAWTHDVLGLERAAVPYYETSLALGLPPEDQAGALLGLGSTYRTLGEYERAKAILAQGMAEFPDRREFPVFYAMALHNLGAHSDAMRILLEQLAATSVDEGIRSYSKAIAFYADKLEQTWD